MQKSRREFVKKAAIASVGAAAVGTTTVLANSATSESHSGNGVVKGHSNKKEILYTKTPAWEEFYKSAK